LANTLLYLAYSGVLRTLHGKTWTTLSFHMFLSVFIYIIACTWSNIIFLYAVLVLMRLQGPTK